MASIVTVTLNPCIDGASEAERVQPTRKTRTHNDRFEPGGGGINVARVIQELGGEATPVYFSGGATGPVLDAMLRASGFEPRPVTINDHTRVSLAVFDTSSSLEYRFVPEGPLVTFAEWDALRSTVSEISCEWLVISGSTPRGLDPSCVAELCAEGADRGARIAVDTSGPALAAVLEAGTADLVKPSIGEFRALTGLALQSLEDVEAASRKTLAQSNLRWLAVTLGHDGALLTTAEDALFLRPPLLPVKSATGAGDSFLGALVHGLASEMPLKDAFRLAVAAGSATVLTPGTGLCRNDDVMDLYRRLAG